MKGTLGKLGLQLFRVKLVGYNGPCIKVIPDQIDFGICPSGECRKAVVCVENLLPFDIPLVSLLVNAESKSCFILENNQVMLKPRAKTHLVVKFEPFDVEGDVNDELVLAAFGSVHKVQLCAISGQSFALLDQKLDFGLVDIYFDGLYKKVVLRNESSNQSLPIGVQTSTKELIVNNGKPIMLEPSEKRVIPVQFTSAISGQRNESIRFFAPFASPKMVEVLALSGPSLLVPIQDDIFFPMASLDKPATVQIPITNIYPSTQQFTVVVPLGSPFRVTLADPDKFNRKSQSGVYTVDAKNYEMNGMSGLVIMLSTLSTAAVDITFHPWKTGHTRVHLDIAVNKPWKSFIKTFCLNGICMDETSPDEFENRLIVHRKFSRNPAREPVLIPTGKRPVSGTHKESKKVTSTIFQMDPPMQVVFGSFLERKIGSDIYEYVTLTNVTNQTQRFRVVVSQHFVIDIPLDGELPGMASLQIPIRLNSYFFTLGVGVNPENAHFGAVGSISIFDDNKSNPGYVTSGLFGLMSDLVSLEVRDAVGVIQFPNVLESEGIVRKFYIRNCTPEDVIWEGAICSMDRKTLLRKTVIASSTSDWCPFSLSAIRINLKPFEYATIEVAFQSNVPGFFQYKLLMEYRDTIEHGGGPSDKSVVEPSRSMVPITLECSVGQNVISHSAEYINFGEVTVGESKMIAEEVINESSTASLVKVKDESPFFASRKDVETTANAKTDVIFQFVPGSSRVFTKSLALANSNLSLSLFCLGIGGTFSISSNLGQLLPTKSSSMLASSLENNFFDASGVGLGLKKSQRLSLCNTGTFDLVVKEIKIQGDSLVLGYDFDCVLWRKARNLDFETSPPDSPEIDWDELDYRSFENQILGSSSMLTAEKKIKSIANSLRRLNRNNATLDATPVLELNPYPIRIPVGQSLDLTLVLSGIKPVSL